MISLKDMSSRMEVIGVRSVTKRLTTEQVWIARLFRAVCADERILGRLGISVDPAANHHPSNHAEARGLGAAVSEPCKTLSGSASEKQEECGVPG